MRYRAAAAAMARHLPPKVVVANGKSSRRQTHSVMYNARLADTDISVSYKSTVADRTRPEECAKRQTPESARSDSKTLAQQ